MFGKCAFIPKIPSFFCHFDNKMKENNNKSVNLTLFSGGTMDLKALVRAYAEAVWNEKRLQAIDEIVHENVCIHSVLGDYSGREAMKQVVQVWLKAFPDLQVKEEQAIVEGDLVSVQWSAEGTQQGFFKGFPPLGNRVHYQGTTVYRIREGKIVEYWAYLDMQHLTQQFVRSCPEVRFETERLLIRTILKEDVPLINAFNERNRDHLSPWESVQDVNGPIERWLREGREGTAVRFLIFQKKDPSLLAGMCNFTQIFHGPFQACYLGYKLDASCEGQGIMHEALQRAIGFIFDEVGMHRIMANYMPSNQRSANLLKRLGFTVEGTAKNYLQINGKWEDHVLTSCSKSTI